MKLLVRVFVLLLLSFAANAEDSGLENASTNRAASNGLFSQIYAGVDVSAAVASIDDEAFAPYLFGGRLGAYVQPQLGLEAYALVNAASAEQLDIELELAYSLGLAARFETPENEGGKLYFLLGYQLSELDMDRSNTGNPGSDTFHGVTFGGGVEFRLGASNDMFLTIQGQRIYDDDDIQFDLFNLGITFLF